MKHITRPSYTLGKMFYNCHRTQMAFNRKIEEFEDLPVTVQLAWDYQAIISKHERDRVLAEFGTPVDKGE